MTWRKTMNPKPDHLEDSDAILTDFIFLYFVKWEYKYAFSAHVHCTAFFWIFCVLSAVFRLIESSRSMTSQAEKVGILMSFSMFFFLTSMNNVERLEPLLNSGWERRHCHSYRVRLDCSVVWRDPENEGFAAAQLCPASALSLSQDFSLFFLLGGTAVSLHHNLRRASEVDNKQYLSQCHEDSI